MKILLTAFEPFGGDSINPALEAVRRVHAPQGAELIRLEVPTVFGVSVDTVTAAMRAYCPDIVLCIGQAAGRAQITPERVAINLDDARIPDNVGAQPLDHPIRAEDLPPIFLPCPFAACAPPLQAPGFRLQFPILPEPLSATI